MSENNQNLLIWKKAKPIFSKLVDLPFAQAIKELNEMESLSQEVKAKVKSLLFGVHAKNTMIEKSGDSLMSQYLMESKDLSGFVLAEYRLISLISKGGMSSIYLGERTDGSVQKFVAIKVLPPWGNSEKILNLFNDEQLILSKLRHPNVVTMHHGGVTSDGVYYTVMDYLEGALTLDQYVSQNDVSDKEMIRIMITVARAISYTHSHLIVHQDLKATNILIDRNAHVFVVDFGIATILEQAEDDNINAYTPEIASPEQIQHSKITVATDVFSLAITFLSLLTQQPALPKVDHKNFEPLEYEVYITKRLLGTSFDQDLKNIFFKALKVNASERYLTMDNLADDLENWLNHKPISASKYNLAKIYKLKIQRNPLASTMIAITVLVMVLSVWLTISFAQSAVKSYKRSEASLHFITSIIANADPFYAKQGAVTIKEVLDNNHSIGFDTVNGDYELKARLHQEMGKMYQHLGLYQSAITQYKSSLNTLMNHQVGESHDALSIRNEIAGLFNELRNVEESIAFSKSVINLIQNNHDSKYMNIKLVAEVNLMNSYGFYSGEGAYNQELFEAKKSVVEGLLATNTNLSAETKIIALNALAEYYVKKNELMVAYNLYEQSLDLTADSFGLNSREYFSTKLEIAIVQSKLGNHRSAEMAIKDLIDDIRKIDSMNSLLGSALDTYATILKFKKKNSAALHALNQSIDIHQELNNLSGLFNSIAKRAMFYFYDYDFKAALLDQAEAIRLSRMTAGIDSPNTKAIIGITSFMLFAVNEVDFANEVMEYAIHQLKTNSENRKNVENFISYAGVFNYQHKRYEKANKYLNELMQLEVTHYLDVSKVFLSLMGEGGEFNYDKDDMYSGESMGFVTRLIHLINLDQNQINSHQLNDLISLICPSTDDFRRFRALEFKQIYINLCTSLILKKGDQMPAEWQEINLSVQQANEQLTGDDRQQIKNLIHENVFSAIK